jgi:glycosyltransferase involved in cell wall biosynthesis
MHVILDVSRLLNCGWTHTPTGIDRVELAYTRHWLDAPSDAASFVAQDLRGGFAMVPRDTVAGMAAELATAWAGSGEHAEAAGRAGRIAVAARLRLLIGVGRAELGRLLGSGKRLIFLLVSHRALERYASIEAIRSAGAAFVPLIHDIIPVTHPEYVRPGGALKHQRRMATAATLADGIIANSGATAAALWPYLARREIPPELVVAPLGVRTMSAATTQPTAMAGGQPHFITLGTIEPRKNHLLLLHLWRDMARTHGAESPRLMIIGKRGWENENVVDILERCTALEGLVQEAGQLADRQVAGLMRGAAALLFPSFAEGYGLPLAEALALGVPAICSDLPALREVGGAVPDYLDPLDGAAWRQAVLDYAQPDSPRRAAQMARMAHWRAPNWGEHFAMVDDMLEKVASPVRRPAPVPGQFMPASHAYPPALNGSLAGVRKEIVQ